jgi:hypothetical protein
MKTHRINVIDGPLPPGIWQSANMEPHLVTAPEHTAVLRELMEREPLFHRAQFGTTRKDFEKMTAPVFWEVGASGRRFSRQFVLETLEKRYENSTEDVWEIGDFHCLEIAADNYLVTYTLIQGERITRRATIWRRTAEGWQVVYHQGTVVAEDSQP